MIIAFVLALGLQTAPQSCCGDMAAFAADPAFIAAHLSPRPINFKAKAGKEVTLPDADGKPFGAFYVPGKPGSKAAIIMIHEYWGLNDYIRREAETMRAETGYAVVAPDMYEGKVATDPKVAGQYMQGVNQARATAIVKGLVADLKNGALGFKPAKIGTIGFCFGGGWSHRTAIQGGPSVNACVMYYGMPDTDPADLANLKAPVLMIHATQDQWINGQVVSNFEKAMADAHKSLDVLHFNAAHAFANPSNAKYDKTSAAKAHAATLAFYKRHFG